MSDGRRPADLSVAAFDRAYTPSARSPTKSPTKSSARAAGNLQLRYSVDDVSYRHADSARATDQAHSTDGVPSVGADQNPAAVSTAASGPHSAEKHSKYMNLLSAVYSHPPGAKPRGFTAASGAPRLYAAGTSTRPVGLPPLATPDGSLPPPLRSSASPKGHAGLPAKGSSTTPTLRRSVRSSILDSSQGASMIPVSPAAAASSSSAGPQRVVVVATGNRGGSAAPRAASPTAFGRLRSSTGSTTGPRLAHAGEPSSPVRRSSPAAQPKAQYAFGSRIEPAAAVKRRPSPTRGSPGSSGSPGSMAQGERVGRLRSAASPQRVPAAARASAPGSSNTGAFRSASAPRMTSADKAQSRFTQHALTAAAAQRSKTPNPAQKAAAAAAAAAANHRVRPQSASASPGSKQWVRMRASDSVMGPSPQHSRPPSFSSSMGPRSPTKGHPGASPILRAGSRSVLAAGGPVNRPGSAGGSRSVNAVPPASRVKPIIQQLDRLALSAAAAPQDSVIMVPTVRDRYKDLYTATRGSPGAIAVEEANAAAAAAAEAAAGAGRSRPNSAAAVPKLALGGLGRQDFGEPLAAPRGPQQQQQQQQHADAVGEGSSPYLGRMAGMTATHCMEGSSSSVRQPQGSFSTPPARHRPAAVPLLALSTITPVPKSRPVATAHGDTVTSQAHGGASPCTPLQCAAGLADDCAAAQPLGLTDIDMTPCPAAAATEDETPSLLIKSQPRTGSSKGGNAGQEQMSLQQEPVSPELAPRDLSAGMQAAQGSSPMPGHLQQPEAAASSIARGSCAVPGLQLPGLGAASVADSSMFDSPPRHRRGERDSPSSSADTGSHSGALKSKAHNLCSSSTASSSSLQTAPPKATVIAAAAGAARPTGLHSAGKPVGPGAAKARQRVTGAAGGSVLEGPVKAATPIRRSLVPGVASPNASTPSTHGKQPRLEAASGSTAGKSMLLASPSKKLGTPVPRLDLTPVLASTAAELDSPCEGHGHQGLLLLEDAPHPRRLELDDDYDDDDLGHRQSAGRGKGPSGRGAPGSGGNSRGGSGKGHGLSCTKKGVPGSKGSQASAEPPPQESFYVYESVMPPEEQKTYEELRRALMKAPGGSKHVANLQGIWGCYQDARRNTEAMAFRGHRLLDQVSTEYNSYKREAEVKLEQLEEERDNAREELQLAMVAGSVPATALQLAAKDRQVRELQEENCMLRQQVSEMEKALQMASDYHSATQAAHKEQQVPVHARVIAGSATTSILTNQVVAQQIELQKVEKRMEDMKAALHLACGVLRQTNYMDTHSELRTQLDGDTLAVLDTIMATEEMEAVAMQQEQAAHMLQEGHCEPAMQHACEAAVHIEELQDSPCTEGHEFTC